MIGGRGKEQVRYLGRRSFQISGAVEELKISNERSQKDS